MGWLSIVGGRRVVGDGARIKGEDSLSPSKKIHRNPGSLSTLRPSRFLPSPHRVVTLFFNPNPWLGEIRHASLLSLSHILSHSAASSFTSLHETETCSSAPPSTYSSVSPTLCPISIHAVPSCAPHGAGGVPSQPMRHHIPDRKPGLFPHRHARHRSRRADRA